MSSTNGGAATEAGGAPEAAALSPGHRVARALFDAAREGVARQRGFDEDVLQRERPHDLHLRATSERGGVVANVSS